MDNKEFKKCCKIILEIPTKTGAMLNYAKSYAAAGLSLKNDEAIRCQILYILGNLSTWKGAEARKIKKILRQINNS